MNMSLPPLTLHKSADLTGSLSVPAAKNSVLPLLAACVLCKNAVTLCGVPALSDVQAVCDMLAALGRPAVRQGADIILPAAPLRTGVLDAASMGRMRSGIFFLAPVLTMTGRVEFATPGGCDLGSRPVDIHLEGLARMGAVCEQRGSTTVLTAPQGLVGCNYALRLPSVGATATMLMAASLAKGHTRLENAALEPEVLDLVRFLNSCGACIRQLPGRRFVVRGVKSLHGGSFTPVADRIWAATILCGVAGCGGDVQLTDIDPATLAGLPALLRRAGCTVESTRNAIHLISRHPLRGVGCVSTGPYPGFATDMAPLLAAVVLRARGTSHVCDKVFTNRFACGAGFAALGAKVQVQNNCISVLPPTGPLHGAELHAQDLRGGAALLLAALQAEGVSRLDGVQYIRRGYQDLPGSLAALGAAIE